MGFWWGWEDVTGHPKAQAYLQIETVPGSVHKLCFKIESDPREQDLQKLKWDMHGRFLEAGQELVERPPTMRVCRTMTLAVWKGDWMAFKDDGNFDFCGTVDNLRQAQRVLEKAAREPS